MDILTNITRNPKIEYVEIEKLQTVIDSIYVEKLVEKKVYVPKYITNTITDTVEVEVVKEVIVEKPVEVIKEVFIDRPVDVFVPKYELPEKNGMWIFLPI